MRQSRVMCLVEVVANVVVGYGVAVLVQIATFPVFGIAATLKQNLAMGQSEWQRFPLQRANRRRCVAFPPLARQRPWSSR